MSQRKTEHLLRTIVLEYDDAKPETEYEKNLIKTFLLLHDKAAAIKQQGAKLLYEYQLLDDRVAEAEKALAPIAETATGIMRETEVMTQKVKDRENIDELLNRLHDFNADAVIPFHNRVLTPLADHCGALDKEYEVYEEAVENFWQEFEAHETESIELYQNQEQHSLDIAVFDDEQEAFKEAIAGLYFEDERNKIINRYDGFIKALNKAYAEIKETQLTLSNYYDDKGLLDSSLSESYASGSNTDLEKVPMYLIPPGDKRVADFKMQYGALANSKNHTLTFSVPVSAVKEGDIFMLQELIMLLQHFPKMIEKWIFAFDITFINNDERELSEDEWKGHEAPVRWFNKLSALPCSIFFIHDHDARAYTLMGDLLADGKLKPAHDGEAVMAEGEALQQIQNRLFNIGLMFLMYCRNTGFDPQPYIESLLADFDAAFTYEDIEKQYLEDMARGIRLQAVPMKGGKEL